MSSTSSAPDRSPAKRFLHRFTEFIPQELDEGVLYITVEYGTAVHLCPCGCGSRVVTPFSPTDWELRFNGKEVSLSPSIGNWSFPCKSHYWIIRNKVRWARRWTDEEIQEGREEDRERKERYFGRLK
jgi:hypothetical protein